MVKVFSPFSIYELAGPLFPFVKSLLFFPPLFLQKKPIIRYMPPSVKHQTSPDGFFKRKRYPPQTALPPVPFICNASCAYLSRAFWYSQTGTFMVTRLILLHPVYLCLTFMAPLSFPSVCPPEHHIYLMPPRSFPAPFPIVAR